jgi:hypothetical protein
MIDCRKGQGGRTVVELESDGIHGDGERFLPDALLWEIKGRDDPGLIILGDDDFRMAETAAWIGEGDRKNLLHADDGVILARADDRFIAFTHRGEKPPASAGKK